MIDQTKTADQPKYLESEYNVQDITCDTSVQVIQSIRYNILIPQPY